MYYWHWLRNLMARPHTTGFPTEADASVARMTSPAKVVPEADPRMAVSPPRILRRSLALRHLDSGSCNGCESELIMLASPDYDLTRYGFSYTPSPKHADMLVVTGVVTDAMAPVIRSVYDQMTAPKSVVTVGVCALSGGVFAASPGVRGGLDGIVPVTVRIDGCPPSPGDILRGLLWAADGVDPLAAARDAKVALP